MPYKERKVQKLYYSIGEVAKLFEVNTSLIRFWEKEFDILKPKKNKKGNRLFTKDDLENLKRILPRDVSLQVLTNKADFIELAIGNLISTGFQAIVLVVLILLFFLI